RGEPGTGIDLGAVRVGGAALLEDLAGRGVDQERLGGLGGGIDAEHGGGHQVILRGWGWWRGDGAGCGWSRGRATGGPGTGPGARSGAQPAHAPYMRGTCWLSTSSCNPPSPTAPGRAGPTPDRADKPRRGDWPAVGRRARGGPGVLPAEQRCPGWQRFPARSARAGAGRVRRGTVGGAGAPGG